MVRKRQRKVSTFAGAVYHDHQRRTCLLVEDGDQVKFIPMWSSPDAGFQLHETTRTSFEQRYKKLPNYPMERAAQLYLNYCTTIGATDEVLDQLSKFIEVPPASREQALNRRTVEAKPVKQVVKQQRRRKKQVVETPSKQPRPKSASGDTSAAKMFQRLIMAGELTDDEIFSQVQTAFDLADNKRSYVKWYRNKLTKDGKNPPEAKQ